MNEFEKIIQDISTVIKGKHEKIVLALTAIIGDGHILLEDNPGVGKTTLAKALAQTLGFKFSRIQFTTDLLPSDILGTQIFDRESAQFKFIKGPIFSDFVLADELNRAPAKTQSALLQAMEEKSVSIENHQYSLAQNFTVVATQNPLSFVGTNDLPESQLDRFAIKFAIGYASKEETIAMMKDSASAKIEHLKPHLSAQSIINYREKAVSVFVDDSLYDYIYRLLEYTRLNKDFLPLSNRAALDLIKLSKAYAFLSNRDHVLPDDIQYLFAFVTGHRLLHQKNAHIDYEHKMANKVLEQVPIRLS